MVLDPITEIEIRVFMAVMVRGGELVVDLQGRRKGRHRQKQQDEADGDCPSCPFTPPYILKAGHHRRRSLYQSEWRPVNCFTMCTCVLRPNDGSGVRRLPHPSHQRLTLTGAAK